MNKNLIPKYTCKNIFSIDFDFIKSLGFKYLFIDLDNTLASPFDTVPNENVKKLFYNLKLMDFDIVIISNNKEKRVKTFVDSLSVKYIFRCKKPGIRKIKAYMQSNRIDCSDCLVIGDQIMTDVNMANHLNIASVLLEPLVKKEELITFFPRLLDKHFRKKVMKNKLAKEI